MQARITIRRQPRFEIQFDDENGPHILRAISADGKSALGSSPTLAILDERGHWPLAQGDELEAALLTGLSKRDGRALIISTSASNDQHPFSLWLDRNGPGTFRQEHRPEPGLPADDVDSLIVANPGTKYGIGPSLDRLKADAALALERGGSALSRFRLLARNERVQEDNRDILIGLDDWLKCEVDVLLPKRGPVVIGLDLGGSASMSAASYFWPESGRLETYGTFPGQPGLDARGQRGGLTGRRTRDWVEARRPVVPPQRISSNIVLDVRLQRPARDYVSRQLSVLPLASGDGISWIDPAGYLVAYCDRPAHWDDQSSRFRFELSVNRRQVTGEPYLPHRAEP